MKKLLLVPLLAVCILALPSCKTSSGAYAAKNGVVLCQHTAIDVDKKPYPLAHAANTGRYHSCDGDEFTAAQLTVTVHLHHVEAIIDGFVISRVCNSNGPVTLGQTSGFTISVSDRWDCPNAKVGDLFFAESIARGRIDQGDSESVSVQRSPHEQWTLP